MSGGVVNDSMALLDLGGRSSEAALDSGRDGVPDVVARFEIDKPFAAIPALGPGQLFAIELALALGLDPARPRGLREVTSTR